MEGRCHAPIKSRRPVRHTRCRHDEATPTQQGWQGAREPNTRWTKPNHHSRGSTTLTLKGANGGCLHLREHMVVLAPQGARGGSSHLSEQEAMKDLQSNRSQNCGYLDGPCWGTRDTLCMSDEPVRPPTRPVRRTFLSARPGPCVSVDRPGSCYTILRFLYSAGNHSVIGGE
ncbi:hypothetical protein KTR9_2429 [Gordonia sp. KTR9]|nr:hypothetical protein KTR9_2429 [Gordonia sp. KTR9]